MSHATAGFTAMTEGTHEDWQIIATEFKGHCDKLYERVLDHMRILAGDYGGFPIDRLEHSLQTATMAHRDGRDDEYSAAITADLKTHPRVTAGCANTNVLILSGIEILRVRIKVGNHAANCTFEKRFIVDGFNIILFYALHHFGKQPRLLPAQLRRVSGLTFTEEAAAYGDAQTQNSANNQHQNSSGHE